MNLGITAFPCRTKSRSIFCVGLVILMSLFLLSSGAGMAIAQEGDIPADTTASDEVVATTSEEEDGSALVEEAPADVVFDEGVTLEDLGEEEAGVLPGSFFHPFKRFGWAVQEMVTFDPIADAELKMKHANQELAGIKQLIDEEGFSEVNPNTISSAIERFEGRLENVKDTADSLKDARGTNPEEIDSLLNELTDKQFTYQKVFTNIEKDIVEAKESEVEANGGVDDIFIQITETKDKALEHFGEVLSTVEEDNPEKIAERIIKVADKQEGSEFKHLKNLEVLKRLEKQVPESVQGAIKLAEENTLKFFNRDIYAVPEEVRAERFEQYNRHSYNDETRQLSLLDELKLLDGIPPEILQKIEEVKEFAIQKFETKMRNFDSTDVLDGYMSHLSGEDFEDILIQEQFASRVRFEDGLNIQRRMNELRDNSVDEFTRRFTDPDSQAQAAKFQELERELERRPGDPKVMRMMQNLEAEVRSNPEKASFLGQFDQLDNKMRFEFEEKFRQEGDQYFDKIGTLDPRDFEVYQEFKGEDFLPDDLAEKFFDRGVDRYRDYMRDVDSPDQFDRFNQRFNDVPQFIIEDIRNRDNGFGDAMQFKRQAMEKIRFEEERQMEIGRQVIDYKERELSHQLDRERRQEQEDFQRQLDSIPYENFEERKALFDQKREIDLARIAEEQGAREAIFEERLRLDPWCDITCQQIQQQFMDQEFRHQQDRIEDDFISQQKRIEFDLSREKANNPLFGLCNTPESCDAYCENNRNLSACAGFYHEPEFRDNRGDFDEFGQPKDYDCGEGNFFDFRDNACRVNPYYIAPTDFTQCGPGSHWEPDKGFCMSDFDFKDDPYVPETVERNCGPDSYFDFRENRCISYRIAPVCPPGSFLGPYGECKQENFQCPDLSVMDFSCPQNQFRDEFIDNNGCKAFTACRSEDQKFQCPDIATMFPAPCPFGESREIITDYNGCQVFSECRFDEPRVPVACPVFDYLPCPEGEYREESVNRDGCFMPGACVPSNVTCAAYFEGYEYNTFSNQCEYRGTSGCSDPFKYHSMQECQEGNESGATGPIFPYRFSSGIEIFNWDDAIRYCNNNPPGSGMGVADECGREFNVIYDSSTLSNWTGHTWYFNDGSEFSSILNRTDAEYLNYISGIDAQCSGISRNSFFWKSGAGDDSASNWQNFGIPDCSGTGTSDARCGDNICNAGESQYTCATDCGIPVGGDCGNNISSLACYSQSGCNWFAGTDGYSYCAGDDYTPPSTYVGDEGCDDLLDILPGCHIMSESPNVRFNTSMDQYIQTGTRTIQYCSSNFIPGCTSDITSGYCGDSVCNSNESSSNCASDCGGTGGMNRCFYANATIKGTPTGYSVWCEADYYNCHEGDSSGAVVSLDGLSLGAPNNCDSGYNSGYCGNNVCDSDETQSSCPSDCGTSGIECGTNNTCASGDYCANYSQGWCCPNGQQICSDGQCVNSISECSSESTGYCGDNVCSSSESSSSCSIDCGEPVTSNCPSGQSECSDGRCVYDVALECPSDSGTTTTTGYCGDNVCDSNEYSSSCPSDCGSSQYGTCDANTDSASCTAESNCSWFSDSSTSYCYYDSGSGGSTYVGDEGCDDLLDILPGCHIMSESPNVRFNTSMDQYIQTGTRTIQYCSSNFIPGCTPSGTSDGYCGDNVCDSNETSSSCSSDCGGTPSSSTCMTASDFGYCENGYDYDSTGCVVACTYVEYYPPTDGDYHPDGDDYYPAGDDYYPPPEGDGTFPSMIGAGVVRLFNLLFLLK